MKRSKRRIRGGSGGRVEIPAVEEEPSVTEARVEMINYLKRVLTSIRIFEKEVISQLRNSDQITVAVTDELVAAIAPHREILTGKPAPDAAPAFTRSADLIEWLKMAYKDTFILVCVIMCIPLALEKVEEFFTAFKNSSSFTPRVPVPTPVPDEEAAPPVMRPTDDPSMEAPVIAEEESDKEEAEDDNTYIDPVTFLGNPVDLKFGVDKTTETFTPECSETLYKFVTAGERVGGKLKAMIEQQKENNKKLYNNLSNILEKEREWDEAAEDAHMDNAKVLKEAEGNLKTAEQQVEEIKVDYENAKATAAKTVLLANLADTEKKWHDARIRIELVETEIARSEGALSLSELISQDKPLPPDTRLDLGENGEGIYVRFERGSTSLWSGSSVLPGHIIHLPEQSSRPLRPSGEISFKFTNDGERNWVEPSDPSSLSAYLDKLVKSQVFVTTRNPRVAPHFYEPLDMLKEKVVAIKDELRDPVLADLEKKIEDDERERLNSAESEVEQRKLGVESLSSDYSEEDRRKKGVVSEVRDLWADIAGPTIKSSLAQQLTRPVRLSEQIWFRPPGAVVHTFADAALLEARQRLAFVSGFFAADNAIANLAYRLLDLLQEICVNRLHDPMRVAIEETMKRIDEDQKRLEIQSQNLMTTFYHQYKTIGREFGSILEEVEARHVAPKVKLELAALAGVELHGFRNISLNGVYRQAPGWKSNGWSHFVSTSGYHLYYSERLRMWIVNDQYAPEDTKAFARTMKTTDGNLSALNYQEWVLKGGDRWEGWSMATVELLLTEAAVVAYEGGLDKWLTSLGLEEYIGTMKEEVGYDELHNLLRDMENENDFSEVFQELKMSQEEEEIFKRAIVDLKEGIRQSTTQQLLYRWLAARNLEQYADAIREQGGTDLTFITDLDDAEVDELTGAVVMEPHHAVIFKSEAQELRTRDLKW